MRKIFAVVVIVGVALLLGSTVAVAHQSRNDTALSVWTERPQLGQEYNVSDNLDRVHLVHMPRVSEPQGGVAFAPSNRVQAQQAFAVAGPMVMGRQGPNIGSATHVNSSLAGRCPAYRRIVGGNPRRSLRGSEPQPARQFRPP